MEERFAHGDPSLFTGTYGVGKFILYVGHIGHERKNVLSLIRALGAIDHPAVLLGPVLKNAYGNECVRQAAKYKQIHVIDGISHDSDLLASAYAACSVFVLPSFFETPGIAALEAALAGAKVVITPHGGAREYFGDSAVYVDPHSVNSIRSGVLSALRADPTYSLREHVRSHFLWGSVAKRTAAVYRSIFAPS